MSQQAVAEGLPQAAEKPAPFSHHYEVAVDWPGDGPGVVSSPPRPAILGGPPPQFQGRSPEHLLLSAASLCLQTTFQFFAAREGLQVSRYASRIEGILDKTPTGIIRAPAPSNACRLGGAAPTRAARACWASRLGL